MLALRTGMWWRNISTYECISALKLYFLISTTLNACIIRNQMVRREKLPSSGCVGVHTKNNRDNVNLGNRGNAFMTLIIQSLFQSVTCVSTWCFSVWFKLNKNFLLVFLTISTLCKNKAETVRDLGYGEWKPFMRCVVTPLKPSLERSQRCIYEQWARHGRMVAPIEPTTNTSPDCSQIWQNWRTPKVTKRRCPWDGCNSHSKSEWKVTPNFFRW